MAKRNTNRKTKDTVFTDLFSFPRYQQELYRALHPEDKRKTINIFDVSLRNVIAIHSYNDLGMTVNGKLMILVEAQSTWSKNIVIRLLMYLMESYNNYFTRIQANLYGSSKIAVPMPELYVIYTGQRNQGRPAYLSFRETFFPKKKCALDVKIKVLYGNKKQATGNIIEQYVAFSQIWDDQIKQYGKTEEAVRETIRICLERGILVDYLTERKVEIMDIMTSLFDQDEVTRRVIVEHERKAERKGKKEGEKQEKLKIAKSMKAMNISAENIAKCTGLTLEQIEKL